MHALRLISRRGRVHDGVLIIFDCCRLRLVEYKILNVYIIITIIHRVTYCRMVIVGGTEGMSRYVDA